MRHCLNDLELLGVLPVLGQVGAQGAHRCGAPDYGVLQQEEDGVRVGLRGEDRGQLGRHELDVVYGQQGVVYDIPYIESLVCADCVQLRILALGPGVGVDTVYLFVMLGVLQDLQALGHLVEGVGLYDELLGALGKVQDEHLAELAREKEVGLAEEPDAHGCFLGVLDLLIHGLGVKYFHLCFGYVLELKLVLLPLLWLSLPKMHENVALLAPGEGGDVHLPLMAAGVHEQDQLALEAHLLQLHRCYYCAEVPVE